MSHEATKKARDLQWDQLNKLGAEVSLMAQRLRDPAKRGSVFDFVEQAEHRCRKIADIEAALDEARATIMGVVEGRE